MIFTIYTQNKQYVKILGLTILTFKIIIIKNYNKKKEVKVWEW